MKKQLFVAMLLIASTTIWFGCKEEEEYTGSISGVVTDFATGEPVKNANVTLRPTGETTLTGSDGTYQFQYLSDGEYSISVSKAEYADLIDDYVIIIYKGKTMKRDVQIKKKVAFLKITDLAGDDISVLDFGSDESVISKSFNVFNNGTVNIECRLTYSCNWISSLTTLPDVIYPGQTVNVTVNITRSNLAPGENTTFLHIVSNNGSSDLKITATGASLPSVDMLSVNDIGYEDATLKGKILNDGLPQYTECGFVVGLSTNPTIEESLQTIRITTPSAEFTREISGLRPNRTYYVRAYALNANGVAYSNEMQFSTKTTVAPNVSFEGGLHLYETGITTFFKIPSLGTPRLLKGGVVLWSETALNGQTMLTYDMRYDAHWTESPTVGTLYYTNIINLIEGETYYICAFAITQYDTLFFGNLYEFTTKVPYETIGSLGVNIQDEWYIEGNQLDNLWSQYAANRRCETLVLGNYDDWRLPTVNELLEIYNHRNELGDPFYQGEYWTSTKNIEEGNFTGSSAWNDGYVSVDFSNGTIKYNNPNLSNNTKHVRAVRDVY